jgi:hypothetical protein
MKPIVGKELAKVIRNVLEKETSGSVKNFMKRSKK